ncbi:hypothetical protein [Legionella sp.]|uniref:hypothetical protein n=1 Tax=Legionella sp. TaxID=459 RepID=UPI003C91514D
MEGYYSNGQETRFAGIIDTINNNTVSIGSKQFYEYGLAPALEYNFTSNLGIIGGVWFPVKGENTALYKLCISN